MKVHFIGIGGIGVSALAREYLHERHQVSGSDQAASLITAELEKLGAKIFPEQKAENVSPDFDLVIYTIALTDHHPELEQARKLKIKIQSYPEALGELSRRYFTIAVAGTHGKTTTTAMIAKICLDAGLDSTVIVGGLLYDPLGKRSNFIAGRSKYLIVEACEYRRSFLHLAPQMLIITNIDADHLDYYRDLADIESAFGELKSTLPLDGTLITEKEYLKIKTDFKLKIPGAHNLKNAQAAIAAVLSLGINYSTAVRSLEGFPGTWRRFEFRGKMSSGALVYDDYAHHPTEIRATLAGAREIVDGKIFAVFQPHLYSRTRQLFGNFAESFADADEVIITDIYAAREPLDKTISGRQLAEAVRGRNGRPVLYFAGFADIAEHLKQKAVAGDLVVTMGAGDISRLADLLLVV